MHISAVERLKETLIQAIDEVRGQHKTPHDFSSAIERQFVARYEILGDHGPATDVTLKVAPYVNRYLTGINEATDTKALAGDIVAGIVKIAKDSGARILPVCHQATKALQSQIDSTPAYPDNDYSRGYFDGIRVQLEDNEAWAEGWCSGHEIATKKHAEDYTRGYSAGRELGRDEGRHSHYVGWCSETLHKELSKGFFRILNEFEVATVQDVFKEVQFAFYIQVEGVIKRSHVLQDEDRAKALARLIYDLTKAIGAEKTSVETRKSMGAALADTVIIDAQQIIAEDLDWDNVAIARAPDTFNMAVASKVEKIALRLSDKLKTYVFDALQNPSGACLEDRT